MPRVEAPAHRIRNDAEAIDVARRLAEQFAEESAVRDREGRLPYQKIDVFSQSGLWGISVPQTYGGAGVSCATLAEVTAIISAADSSLGQIPQNHYAMVEAIRLSEREDQHDGLTHRHSRVAHRLPCARIRRRSVMRA